MSRSAGPTRRCCRRAIPRARAAARITEDVCDTQYEAVNWGYGEVLWYGRATGELAAHLRAQAARQTAILQDWLATRLGDGPWFGGAAFGWADAAAAPTVNRSVHYGLGPTPGSPLADWHRRLCARPSVAATFAEFDAGIARVTASAELFRTGARRREYRGPPARVDGEVGRHRRGFGGTAGEQHPVRLARVEDQGALPLDPARSKRPWTRLTIGRSREGLPSWRGLGQSPNLLLEASA